VKIKFNATLFGLPIVPTLLQQINAHWSTIQFVQVVALKPVFQFSNNNLRKVKKFFDVAVRAVPL
jgi:hypothetical protein